MNDYQKELWKKRQEYELAHKDNSKLPVKPKKKKKKVKSNTDNYVTGKVKQTTNKATKDAKNKAHMQDLVNTTKTKQATKKATKDAKRNAHTNDYSNITDSTKNGKKKKSKLKHSDVYLAHHGVEGQKWGKRHGPPYPLDSDVSTGNRLKKDVATRHTTKELKESIKAKKKTGEKLTDEERIYRNTRRGAMVGGVVGGIIAGAVTSRKIKKENETNNAYSKSLKDQLYKVKTDNKDDVDVFVFKTKESGSNAKEQKKLGEHFANAIKRTGANNYASHVLDDAAEFNGNNWPEFNRFKNKIDIIQYIEQKSEGRFSYTDDSAFKAGKKVKDKSGKSVSGSLKYKDRLELQTDPDGNYTSGTLYRDYYDSEDDEYIDAKIIRELNSTKGG